MRFERTSAGRRDLGEVADPQHCERCGKVTETVWRWMASRPRKRGSDTSRRSQGTIRSTYRNLMISSSPLPSQQSVSAGGINNGIRFPATPPHGRGVAPESKAALQHSCIVRIPTRTRPC